MTIKELADKLGYYIESDDIGSGNDLLNTLVEAAEREFERGRAEGAEQMVQKIQKAAYRCKPGETLHINNSIPMLVLVSSVVNPEDADFEPKHYRCTWNKEPFGSCEDYRKAGGQAEHCPWFEDKDDHLHLSPAPKEPTIYAVGDNGEGGESHSATSSGDHWEQKLVHGPEIAGLG
jgi:hypothetical protein